MRYQKCFILLISILLYSCKDISIPSYWSCSGLHTQVVVNSGGEVIERYGGRENLFFEIYKKSVSQFNAPATFGVYTLCKDSQETIIFSSPECLGEDGPKSNSKFIYERRGVLNKKTGSLVFNEIRSLIDKKIVSSGIYECRLLGHYYSYEDMRPADAI